MNKEFGYGGMLSIDVGSKENANKLMEQMQKKNLGYLAVSLGFYKTLFVLLDLLPHLKYLMMIKKNGTMKG